MDIAAVQAALDPADLAVTLELAREPVGRYLFVGQSQRYQVLLRKGEQQEPAAEVAWPPDFENQLVRWRAPVLTAKQAGHQQWLTARCGGRAIRFDTVAIEPRSASALPSRRPDQPIEVRVLSDQGPGVALPVGAEFDDFRVEAEYADGFVRIFDRKKDMLNRGGYKIFSVEVENLIVAMPGVVEAAVVGRPCPVLGERVHAFVYADDPAVTVDAIRRWCAERLADYKVPETVTLSAEPLPRNANGKLLKRVLREAVV